MHTPASVTSTLQRLFSRQPNLSLLFRPSGYPEPDAATRLPAVPHADFMDTRPVIFRSEGFDDELLPTRGRA
jgi:hypothetical protein